MPGPRYAQRALLIGLKSATWRPASGAAGALYWGLPERQRVVMKNGMFYSGDLGYRDEQGVVWFKARDVDIIKSSGYLIAPYEIEDALSRHSDVTMVGCIGVSDPVKGEIIKAFIKLRPGVQGSNELIADLEGFGFCRVHDNAPGLPVRDSGTRPPRLLSAGLLYRLRPHVFSQPARCLSDY